MAERNGAEVLTRLSSARSRRFFLRSSRTSFSCSLALSKRLRTALLSSGSRVTDSSTSSEGNSSAAFSANASPSARGGDLHRTVLSFVLFEVLRRSGKVNGCVNPPCYINACQAFSRPIEKCG